MLKLKHAAALPASGQDALAVIFTDPKNISAAASAIDAYAGIKPAINKKAGDKGAVTLFANPGYAIALLGTGSADTLTAEEIRRMVCQGLSRAAELKATSVVFAYPGLEAHPEFEDLISAMAEAARLASYQFLTYKTDSKPSTVKEAVVVSSIPHGDALIARVSRITEAVAIARDLVNEPVITLTATELANRAVAYGKKFGFSVEVFNKKKIESLKMGGLLAVNYGSPEPPTFTVLEYKPSKPLNKKPIVLVGKGIVFDTGGLSLKPTPDSMDQMKSDMAGAAAVIGTFCSIAQLKLHYHVIGLIPATDNRPGGNAYTPGDVIRMMSGTTIEVLNTDAEGRMVLADALHFAKQYKPELVIDLATLTGAAVVAVGTQAIAMMSTAGEKVNTRIRNSGFRTHERMVELPLWDEYKDQLKSDIADMKNVGGRYAGSITAGKFLEHFTDYPWIHLDIAGPAFLTGGDSYRGKGGTGVGVRLLTDFIESYAG